MGVALGLLLVALVPFSGADGSDPGCADRAELRPHLLVGVEAERDRCQGRAWMLAARDPGGRTEVRWYDDARGVGIEAHRAPRFVAWWQDAEGCHLILYAFGAQDLGCVAGAPPAPPAPPAPAPRALASTPQVPR